MIVALAGGVGGARLAVGLAQVLAPRDLAIVVNTADDFEHLGLAICPDLDTVMYTLAGVNNRATGWGRARETWSCMQTLGELGGPTWFNLGDRDLALNLLRTQALRRGMPLGDVTEQLARALSIRHAVLPMSETPVRTRVRTSQGELAFQDYFVRLRCGPRVRGFRFAGARAAELPRRLRAIIASQNIEAVVICPSNPFVSVRPILSVPAVGAWLRGRQFPIVAVSPIVGGAAIKGPAAKMMRELGVEVSALGIARHYGKLIDGWVIDRADASLGASIEASGWAVTVTDTIMRNRIGAKRLARVVVALARANWLARVPDSRKRDLWVVVPMRGIAQGKTRLAQRLDRAERARLNRRLLERTLKVISAWQGRADRCIVISGCAHTLRIAQRAGVLPLIEPRPGRGLNHAVGHAVRHAIRCGARAIAVLASDLPLLSCAALDALAAQAADGHAVVIAPDALRTGTNALLLKTRARFTFSFGAQSCARHVEAARLRGWRFAFCTHPDLALDIDVPEDLAAWRDR